MDAIRDFEDIIELLEKHKARYLVVGGLAFVYHAKPRFTKDIDLWVAPDDDNVQRVNRALREFGSPMLIRSNSCVNSQPHTSSSWRNLGCL